MSVRFDASGDYLTIGSAPSTTFTITAWAYLSTGLNNYQTIGRLHSSSGGGSTVATWATDVDGTSGPNYYTGSGSVTNGTNFIVGEWRKVGITRSGSTGSIYVATPSGSTEVDSGTVSSATAAGITFGARGPDDTTERFDGRIAYARVWTSALSQAQIEAEWNSATAVVTSGLWASWPLTVHTNLQDVSGNARHLTGAGTLTTEADPTLSTPTAAFNLGFFAAY